MGDKPLDRNDWPKQFQSNGDIYQAALEKLKKEGIDVDESGKFRDAINSVKKEYEGKTNDEKRKKETEGTIISKIVGKYKKGTKGSDKSSDLPLPPLDFVLPFTVEEQTKGDIFYLIREAAKGNVVTNLLSAISTKDYTEEYKKQRTIRVPTTMNLKDNTKGEILPKPNTSSTTTSPPAPASATSAPAPASATSPPAPASATSAPAPASATSAPAPATTTSPPAPASATSAPAPASATSAPAPASATSAPAPATTTSAPAPATTTSAPAPASAPAFDTLIKDLKIDDLVEQIYAFLLSIESDIELPSDDVDYYTDIKTMIKDTLTELIDPLLTHVYVLYTPKKKNDNEYKVDLPDNLKNKKFVKLTYLLKKSENKPSWTISAGKTVYKKGGANNDPKKIEFVVFSEHDIVSAASYDSVSQTPTVAPHLRGKSTPATTPPTATGPTTTESGPSNRQTPTVAPHLRGKSTPATTPPTTTPPADTGSTSTKSIPQPTTQEIPETCKSSKGEYLKIGSIIRVSTRSGATPLAQIIQYHPNTMVYSIVKNVKVPLACEITVQTIFEPMRELRVNTSNVYLANKDDIQLAQAELANRAPKLLGYCKLTNLGNTCFINSVLQMLWSIDSIREYFRKTTFQTIDRYTGITQAEIDSVPGEEYNGILKRGLSKCLPDKINQNKELLKAFAVLFKVFGTSKKDQPIDISTIKVGEKSVYDIISSNILQYRKGEQDDALGVFNALSAAMLCFVNSTEVSRVYKTFLSVNSKTYTFDTGKKPGLLDPQATIQIPITETGIDIQTKLNSLQQPKPFPTKQKIATYNDFASEESNTIQVSTNNQFLLIVVNRFGTGDQNSPKNRSSVTVNPTLTIDNTQYKIKGTVLHQGATMRSGHYVYIIYDGEGKPQTVVSDIDILEFNDTKYNPKTDGYIYLYQKVSGQSAGGPNQPPRDTLETIGDLVDYTKAFADYGLSKTKLKNILNIFIELEAEPGGQIKDKIKGIYDLSILKTNIETKKTKEEELEELLKQIDSIQQELDIDEYTTLTSTGKAQNIQRKEDLKQKKQEQIKLESEITDLNEKIIGLDDSRRLFQSKKQTDDQILNSLSSISKIGSALDQLVEKIKLVKTYIDENPENPISLTEVEDIKENIIRNAKATNFNVTPIQYAVLVGTKNILEALIRYNIPVDEETTRTDPSKDGTTYTLRELAKKRDPKDPKKKEVDDFLEKINNAQNRASNDFSQPTPQRDEKFLADPNNEYSIKLVYTKTFQQLLQKSKGPTADLIDINIIRYADEIKKAKEDANKRDTKTKTQGIPDPDLYRPDAWKSQSPGLAAPSAAYTKYYQMEVAKIKGTIDGRAKLPRSPEYDGNEYKNPPLLAVGEAYNTAYRIASATDYDRGFYDGLAAKAVSEYITGTGFWFLEPEYADALLETGSASIKNVQPLAFPKYGTKKDKETPTSDMPAKIRDDYKQGYNDGIEQFLASDKPVDDSETTVSSGYYDTIMAATKRAAIIDVENNYPMYTTPAEYIAADTRSYEFDRSKKDILIQVYLNKLIKNYIDFMKDPEWKDEDYAKAREKQARINRLKDEYDATYQTAKTKQVQALPSPPPAPIKPVGRPEPKKAGTRKHTKKSPKRRTLRRK